MVFIVELARLVLIIVILVPVVEIGDSYKLLLLLSIWSFVQYFELALYFLVCALSLGARYSYDFVEHDCKFFRYAGDLSSIFHVSPSQFTSPPPGPTAVAAVAHCGSGGLPTHAPRTAPGLTAAAVAHCSQDAPPSGPANGPRLH